MASLYELTEDYKELLAMAEDEELDSELLADTLEGIEGSIEEKAEACAKIMKELAGESAAIQTEIDRLANRARLMDNNAKRLKERIYQAMLVTGKRKLKTMLFSFNIQKNTPSLVIDQEDRIPKEYWVKQEPKLDKPALKKWLKDNPADFAHLEQSEGLRIR